MMSDLLGEPVIRVVQDEPEIYRAEVFTPGYEGYRVAVSQFAKMTTVAGVPARVWGSPEATWPSGVSVDMMACFAMAKCLNRVGEVLQALAPREGTQVCYGCMDEEE